MFDEVLDAHLDHLRLSFEHGNHFHDLRHQFRVFKSLVRFHDCDDLTVDDGAALSLDVVVLFRVLVSHLVGSLFGDTCRNQIHAQRLTCKLQV